MIIPGTAIILIALCAFAFLLAWLLPRAKVFNRNQQSDPSVYKPHMSRLKWTGTICLILSVWELVRVN